MMTRIARTLSALVLVFGVTGCATETPPTFPVRLSGMIVAPESGATNEKVFVSLYHAWALEGELRHPVQFIESFEAEVGAFSHEFAYPESLGEGLLVYAWLDTDGDGVLCTPSARSDLAGLTEVEVFPADSVVVDVTLNQACAGPDWFYPQ